MDAERLDVDVDVSWELVPRNSSATGRSETVESSCSRSREIVNKTAYQM